MFRIERACGGIERGSGHRRLQEGPDIKSEVAQLMRKWPRTLGHAPTVSPYRLTVEESIFLRF